jgi:hypothetical protein
LLWGGLWGALLKCAQSSQHRFFLPAVDLAKALEQSALICVEAHRELLACVLAWHEIGIPQVATRWLWHYAAQRVALLGGYAVAILCIDQPRGSLLFEN